MKIISISDIHYSKNRGGRDILDSLIELIDKINLIHKPDLVTILGDLVDDEAVESVRDIYDLLDSIKADKIVIPGNHDCNLVDFFKIFPDLPPFLDVGYCRFIPFVDIFESDFNATRRICDIEKMKEIALEFDGPVISLQHVPLLFSQKVQSVSDFNYTNYQDIFEAAIESGVTHTLSGHYHKGCLHNDPREIVQIVTPAFIKKDNKYLEIVIEENSNTDVKICELRNFDN